MIVRNYHIFSCLDCLISLEKRREEVEVEQTNNKQTYLASLKHSFSFRGTGNFLKRGEG